LAWPALENDVYALISLVGIVVFAVVAYGDLRTRRIANGLSIAVAALGLARLAVIGDWSHAIYTIAAAAAVLAVAYLMFWRGWLGGGDAKLLPAAALLVGWHDLFGFLLLMSLAGAVLALAVLAAGRFGGPLGYLLPVGEANEAAARPSVPYGVAIAAAAVLILVLQTPLVK
jgi:prepilin peptidase CpaA